MEINELEILECLYNLDDDARLKYLQDHNKDIGKAAKAGADAIKKQQALDKLLRCWGTLTT